jgi:G3E family GTPase
VILLNKIDLADAAAIAAVEARIRTINPYAKIVHSARCAVPLDQVIGLDAFSLERVLAVEPDFLTSDHDHEHEEEVTSISLAADQPLDPDRFQVWFGQLIQRAKGILHLAGEDRRYVMQGVHMLIEANFLGPWPPGPRISKLVFIGRNLDTMDLDGGFKACQVD